MYFLIVLNLILKSLAIIVPLLVAVAYLTLLERKVMASMQQRRGPNVVCLFGLLQPLADGLKLLIKEKINFGPTTRILGVSPLKKAPNPSFLIILDRILAPDSVESNRAD